MNTFNCEQTTNGFVATSNYITGPRGEQLDEYDGTASNLVHSNIFAAGRLLATYKGIHLDVGLQRSSNRLRR